MDPMSIMTAIGLGMQGAQMGMGFAGGNGQQMPYPQVNLPPPMQQNPMAQRRPINDNINSISSMMSPRPNNYNLSNMLNPYWRY